MCNQEFHDKVYVEGPFSFVLTALKLPSLSSLLPPPPLFLLANVAIALFPTNL